MNSKLVESDTAVQNSVQHNAMSIQWKDERSTHANILQIRKDNDFRSCGKEKTRNSIKSFNYKS